MVPMLREGAKKEIWDLGEKGTWGKSRENKTGLQQTVFLLFWA